MNGDMERQIIKRTIAFVNVERNCVRHDNTSAIVRGSFFVVAEDGTTIVPKCGVCAAKQTS